jgi:hypothetical protein
MASTFVDSWRALNLDKSKEKCISRSQPITSLACETSVEEKANLVCVDLLKNPKMKNCLKMFNEDILMKNCISDYCNCKNSYERTECICNGISVLAKDCRFRGVTLDDGWRDWQICRKLSFQWKNNFPQFFSSEEGKLPLTHVTMCHIKPIFNPLPSPQL